MMFASVIKVALKLRIKVFPPISDFPLNSPKHNGNFRYYQF
jgi:hypothetical protein